MRYLILSIYPAALPFKGHARSLQRIAIEVAKFNGSVYGSPDSRTSEETDQLINRIITEANEDFHFERRKGDTETVFGHQKSNGEYTEYGKIIKMQLL